MRVLLDRYYPLGRATGANKTMRQAAGSRSQLEHLSRLAEVNAAGQHIGEAAAAGIGRSNLERAPHPKAKEDYPLDSR